MKRVWLLTYYLPLTTYHLLLTTYYLLLTTYYLLLTTYYLLLTTYYFMLTTSCLLLTTYYLLLTTHYLLLTTDYWLLTTDYWLLTTDYWLTTYYLALCRLWWSAFGTYQRKCAFHTTWARSRVRHPESNQRPTHLPPPICLFLWVTGSIPDYRRVPHGGTLPTVAQGSVVQLARSPQDCYVIAMWLLCDCYAIAMWCNWLGPHKIFELYGATEAQAYTLIRGDEWLRRTKVPPPAAYYLLLTI